jgi:threonine dehydratase
VAEGRVNVHGFDDPFVKAGQGTLALEALEETDLDAIVAPVGGGGLVCGVATAAKGINPAIRVIGVEPSGAARYEASRKAGHLVKLDHASTIADGTRVPFGSEDNYQVIEALGVELVTADDSAIRQDMRLMISEAKMVAEPSSAMVISAAREKKICFNTSDKVCFVISGGNNDLSQLAEILIKA